MKKLTLKKSWAQDDKENHKKAEEEEKNHENARDESLSKEWRYACGHPKNLIIGDPS